MTNFFFFEMEEIRVIKLTGFYTFINICTNLYIYISIYIFVCMHVGQYVYKFKAQQLAKSC